MISITRLILIALVFCIAITCDANALKLASWNMEHLADGDGEGCRPRQAADYLALRQHADRLGADSSPYRRSKANRL
ncbi:hypothetical protein [Bradyrhizobium sp. Ai1a-2]|uniref:hypothetical protein n=1 Tax=Bradyrhizobium sp. Ai1a-2 TaxID=196490 RepID=UPI0006858E36|nr:hypothetical protein [Bradyrhizobium sp. Ai1a-2]